MDNSKIPDPTNQQVPVGGSFEISEKVRTYKIVAPIIGFILYGLLVYLGQYIVAYIIYHYVNWQGFGDIIMMLMWMPVVYLVPLFGIYFFLRKFKFTMVTIFLLLVVYPDILYTLSISLNRYEQARYIASDTCSSATQWDCQSGYHEATFIPLYQKAVLAQDPTICRGTKDLKDYSMLWSESRCIAEVFQSGLPDLDGNTSTNDYISSIGQVKDCPLKEESYSLSGLVQERGGGGYKTHDTGYRICFYEYPDANNLTKDINSSVAASSSFYTFDNILIQYIGNNLLIANYLRNKVTPIEVTVSSTTAQSISINNSKRNTDVTSILDAILRYRAENGRVPQSIPIESSYHASFVTSICKEEVAAANTFEICKSGAPRTCGNWGALDNDSRVNLDKYLISSSSGKKYLDQIPTDPEVSQSVSGSGYYIAQISYGAVVVCAPHTEGGAEIVSGILTDPEPGQPAPTVVVAGGANWDTFKDNIGFQMHYLTDTNLMSVPTSEVTGNTTFSAFSLACPTVLTRPFSGKSQNMNRNGLQYFNGSNYCKYESHDSEREYRAFLFMNATEQQTYNTPYSLEFSYSKAADQQLIERAIDSITFVKPKG